MVQIYKNEAVIFDLDDLLYKEFEFMRSAFWEISQTVSTGDSKQLFKMMMVQYFSGNAVLTWLHEVYLSGDSNYPLTRLVSQYRNHNPNIALSTQAKQLLDNLKANGNKIGILTDGRSITQRNKIYALGLETWADVISISEECGYEKPSEKPYKEFERRFNSNGFVYLADNFAKDFLAPKRMGWRTIALLDNGLNIHSWDRDISIEFRPDEEILDLSEIVVVPDAASYGVARRVEDVS